MPLLRHISIVQSTVCGSGPCGTEQSFQLLRPVDVDEGLGVHVIDVEDAVQVVDLMLQDTGRPAACLPRHRFTFFIQTCRNTTKSHSTNVSLG